jgi:hypothetical protein
MGGRGSLDWFVRDVVKHGYYNNYTTWYVLIDYSNLALSQYFVFSLQISSILHLNLSNSDDGFFSGFFKASDLLSVTRNSKGVFVKDQGFFIFGGDGNNWVQTQTLHVANGNWQYGPDLYERLPVRGQCYFQVGTDFYASFFTN